MQLLTSSVLIARLINAHQHLLALRISEYLGMNQVFAFSLALILLLTFILFQWIIASVDTDLS